VQASTTTALTAPSPSGGGGALRLRQTALIIGGIALVSLLLGLFQLLRARDGHDILEYDDGVWFGASLRLIEGALPYRDFVLDQPPGVPLLLAPVAFLSKAVGSAGAFAIARYVTITVEAVNVALVGWLLRHRSAPCVVVACTVVAVYPTAVITSRTVMLEPYCDLFCLLGLVAAFDEGLLSSQRRRALLAGIAFGAAGACKGFALFPFAVLVGQMWFASRGEPRGTGLRRSGLCVGAAATTFAVICSPFLIAAPRAFFDQVVVAQLTRGIPAMTDRWARAAQLLGVPPAPQEAGLRFDGFERALVVAVAALVVAAMAATWWSGREAKPQQPQPWTGATAPVDRTEGRGRRSLARYGVVCTLVTAAGLSWPAAFYYHYAAFLAPFGAIPLGVALEVAARAKGARVVGTATASVLLVVGTAHAVRTVQTVDQPGHPQVALVERVVPKDGCTATDNPSLLILANRFVAPGGCTDLVDAYGSTLAWGDGHPRARGPHRSAAVHKWIQVLDHTDYLVLTGGLKPGRIPWDTMLLTYLHSNFRRAASERGVAVWARRQTAPGVTTGAPLFAPNRDGAVINPYTTSTSYCRLSATSVRAGAGLRGQSTSLC